jgi:peptidyl-prolyl cis-trans isomerase A (cyclophilin A)
MEKPTMRNSSLFPRLRRAKASVRLRRRTFQAERLESRELLAADPIVTVDTNFGNFQIELLPGAAPQTVANFLSYVDSGAYTNSIFHRSVPGFIEQSGGYTSASDTFSGDASQFSTIPTHTPIPLEYNLPNALGTVGMARTSDPNSGTDQWFVNMTDNSQTLSQGNGGGFAVFGKILGNGMQVLTAIAQLPTTNADHSGAFSQLPLGANNQLVRISSISVDSIDGTVFNDANDNGQLDPGEAGVAGRTIFIDSNGTGVAGGTNPTTTTDAQGNYSFTGLAPGTYTVREVAPFGVRSSEPLQTVTVSADHTASGVNFGETTIPKTFYVDAKLTLVLDRDSSGGLSAGDEVTFGQGQSYEQDNLTYDAAPTGGDTGTAFSSISQALASPLVQAGDTIDIAGGTYSEFGITINKDLTLEGLGKVVINAAQPQPLQPIGFSPDGASLASTNVFVYPDSVGIRIINNPNKVTLANLDPEGFATSLSCNGCGTLDLTDLALNSDQSGLAEPPWYVAGAVITNVGNLNLTSTTASPRRVVIGLQPSLNIDYGAISLFDGSDRIFTDKVDRLSVTTGAGADSYYVVPLPATTITLNGGNPTPPASPGDTLEINFSGTSGADLATSDDSSGDFGSWTFANQRPIVFKNFETLLPASASSQGDLTLNLVEGADRHNLVVGRFVDPNGPGPVSDYSADITWGDGGFAMPAAVSFDPASNQFTVTDNADIGRYTEDGTYTVVITVHRSGHPDIILTAKAIVAEPTIEGTGLTILGSAGVPLAGSHGLSTFAARRSGNAKRALHSSRLQRVAQSSDRCRRPQVLGRQA